MRKMILFIAAALTAFVARGDERGDAIVARMSAAVGAMKHYEIRFNAYAEGMDPTPGTIVVSGTRYNIKIANNEQFSDGRYKYDIMSAQREVVIDKIDAASHNILSNPVRAFSFASSEFTSRYLSSGKVELMPKNSGAGIGKIILSINGATSLPTELVYDYDGQQIRIAIVSFTSLANADEGLFRYNASKYRGWDVVDFR